jgi:hypothetical protein
MKIKVKQAHNKKYIGKIFDLGNVISGDLEKTATKGNFMHAVKFDRNLIIGKEEFLTKMSYNTSANNWLTVNLTNIVKDKFGNNRTTIFSECEIL